MNLVKNSFPSLNVSDTSTSSAGRMNICLRTMTSSDYNRIAELEKIIFPAPWSIETIRHLFSLSPKCEGYVADHEGQIIGYAIAWSVEEETHVANIAVCKEYRRKMIGSSLIDAIIQKAMRDRSRYVCLEVRESNRIAVALYKKFGFQQVDKRESYYTNNNEDALLLMKLL